LSGATFRRSERALWRRAGDDVVATLPESDAVRFLTGGAAAVWWALEEPGTPDALVDDLAATFDVGAEAIVLDVRNCLEDLFAMRLVEQES
jgi:Coenzyme PQQ synthesis protein D (PqqD)